MPKKSSLVDFKAVKAAITMEQILEHYGLMGQFKRSGDSLSGPCPIHKGSNPTQFRVSTSKNIWNCFSECKHGGNTLDFIARMENVTIHAAAVKAIEWFNLDRDAMSASSAPDESEPEAAKRSSLTPKASSEPSKALETSAPNKPLKFRLDKLEREHPYLANRGLTLETIVDFGVGYCSKGIMAQRIAIPIHNPQGEVVAYAGRLATEELGDTHKYRLPPGFKKSMELFNIDRALKEPPATPLVVVEGYFDCAKLHQNGHRKVVALMGSTMSIAQEELIRMHFKETNHVIVIMDEDDAGRAGRDDIASRLARFFFVKVHVFGKEGSQPEHLSAEEVAKIIRGAI